MVKHLPPLKAKEQCKYIWENGEIHSKMRGGQVCGGASTGSLLFVWGILFRNEMCSISKTGGISICTEWIINTERRCWKCLVGEMKTLLSKKPSGPKNKTFFMVFLSGLHERVIYHRRRCKNKQFTKDLRLILQGKTSSHYCSCWLELECSCRNYKMFLFSSIYLK